MRRAVVWLWRSAALLLLAASLVEACRTLADPRAGWWYLVNSDTLNIPGFYQNVVLDGYTWRAYRPSAATFAFPDGLLYFAIRPFLARTAAAVVLWELVCFALLVGTAIALGQALLPRDRRAAVAPSIGFLAAAFLGYCALTRFDQPAIELALPVYHNGALTCTFLALVLVLRVVRSDSRGARAGWGFALALLSVAAAFSDRLYCVYFVLPAAAAGAVVRLFFTPRPPLWSWGRHAVWVAATAVGCAVGMLTLKAVTVGGDQLGRYWSGGVWDGLRDRAANVADAALRQGRDGDLLVLSAAAWYPLALLFVASALRRRRDGVDRRPLTFYCLTSLFMFAGIVVAYLLSGASVELYEQHLGWRGYSRYFIGPFGAAYFGWAFLLAEWIGAATRAWARAALAVTPAWLAAALIAASAAEPKTATYDVLDYYPPYARRIDEACARHGVRHGAGAYWQARELTLLSRAGLRVTPIATDETSRFRISSHLWLSNAEEAWKPPAGWVGSYQFEFVVATPHPAIQGCLYSTEVIDRLGEPADRTPAEALEVLFYTRPRDAVFQHFADLDLDVQAAKYQLEPTARRRFFAIGYRAGGGTKVDGFSVAAPERFDGPAIVASGPYLVPRLPGAHRVSYRVTAPSGAVVDVVQVDPVTRQVTTVAFLPVPPGTDGTVALDVEVTPPMKSGMLEFRLIRTVPGPLVFHWVEFEKLP